jgi:hypothetical protein
MASQRSDVEGASTKFVARTSPIAALGSAA